MTFSLRNRGLLLVAALAVASAFFAVTAAAPQSGDDIEAHQKELEKIHKKIQQHRANAKKLSSQEKQTLSRLSGLDKEIDLAQQYVGKLNEQERLMDQHIGDLHVQIGNREQVLAQQEDALAHRLRQMYKRDPSYRWEILLGAKSINDAITRYQFMKIIAAQDAHLIDEYRDGKHQLEVQTAALAQSMQEVTQVRQSREAEAEQLQATKKERERTLTEIRSEKSKNAAAIKELEKAEAQVQKLLDDIIRRRASDKDLPPSGDFVAMKGRLPWPVEGKLIRGFGKHVHPKYGTVTMNNGYDIKAASGAPIIAVAAGVVEFVDWIDAFGKCVILNHGGGYYTLYAHVGATMVVQGQKVSGGQAIAEVGDTGSLDGYVCHFEVRKARQALDPADWLRKKRSS